MQIVINISEESYKNIKEQVDKRDYPDMQIRRAIADGVLIPKCHGRLVDVDEVIKIANKTKDLHGAIWNAQTIIEADKEQE